MEVNWKAAYPNVQTEKHVPACSYNADSGALVQMWYCIDSTRRRAGKVN